MHNPGDSGAVGSLTLLREVGGPVHMQDKPHLVCPGALMFITVKSEVA